MVPLLFDPFTVYHLPFTSLAPLVPLSLLFCSSIADMFAARCFNMMPHPGRKKRKNRRSRRNR